MELYEQIVTNGYAVARGAASEALLRHVDSVCTRANAHRSTEEQKAQEGIGAPVGVASDSEMVDVALSDELFNLVPNLVFAHAMVFNKLAHSTPTFWHQDFACWNDPAHASETPHQIQMLIYTRDTQVDTGCLRVIPGTHRCEHPLHRFWQFDDEDERVAAREALRRAANTGHPAFMDDPAQVAVEIERGDVVLTDARVLHGAFANNSDRDRPLLTMWFFHRLELMLPGTRSRIAQEALGKTAVWASELTGHQRDRLPYYGGSEPMLATDFQPRFG